MRPTIYPTHVNLKDLPDEGESFAYTRQSGELNRTLEDLIAKHDYNVNLHLTPMGNAFEITGKIQSTMTLPCARCGRDMESPIRDEFQELIVVMPDTPKGGHSGHTGSLEDGPFCNYASSYNFDLAEFVREHIAASEPYTPLCGQSDCEAYFIQAQNPKDLAETTTTANPFSVLKDLQIKTSQKS